MFDEDPGLGQVREKHRVPLEQGERIAERVRADLEPLSETILLAGSIRRRRPTIADVEFVILPKNLDAFDKAVKVFGFEAGAKRRKYTGIVDGIKVELYVAHKPEELGAMLLTYTGDYLLNIAMRSKAKRMGYKLDQYGIWKGKKLVFQNPDERQFFDFLGMDWHWPEQRSLAARSELYKMARKLHTHVAWEKIGFVESVLESLRTEKMLQPTVEAELKKLYAERFGSASERVTRAAMGAEELIELGILPPDGVAHGDGSDTMEDPRGLWQSLYERATGRSGTVTAVGIRPYDEDGMQIWLEADEGGARQFYIAFTGPVQEGEIGVPMEEILIGFASVMLDDDEAPVWLGPFRSLPEAG